MLCQLKNYRKCLGDLVLDGDEWRCWQCGHYYYARPERETLFEEPPEPVSSDQPPAAPAAPRMKATRSLRDINGAIATRNRRDKRWWIRNMEIIRTLDDGCSVKEIAKSIGRGPRQVRVVRERLYDMRSTGIALEIPI